MDRLRPQPSSLAPAPGSTSYARALLDPKSRSSTASKPKSTKPGPYYFASLDGSSEPPATPSQPSPLPSPTSDPLKPPPTGLGKMMENMHNVEQRQEERTVKRQKTDRDGENDGQKVSQKDTNSGRSGGGEFGPYLKQKREEAAKGSNSSVVDLTNDDDDDVVLVKDNMEREVCLGRIEHAHVNAHMVPHPKMNMMSANTKTWMPFKVELGRRGANTQIIPVRDPLSKDFGTIDVRTATVLAQLMDSARTTKIRLEARLDPRKKEPFETPGQLTSKSMPITIHVYAPLKFAKGLGRLFSQRQVWLREPHANLGGREYFNPQAPQDFGPKRKKVQAASAARYSSPSLGHSQINRTAEEIRNDVFRVFDTLKAGDELSEMEPPSSIKTPLLVHQKQGLHWLVGREKEIGGELNAEENDGSLWQVYHRNNGAKVYYNVITGHESIEKPKQVLGGILADVMGLGKTLMILSLIAQTQAEAEHHGDLQPVDDGSNEGDIALNSQATLLICPLSTIANWEEQIKAHTKTNSLHYLVYHGSSRTDEPADLQDYDIIITTYTTVSANARWQKSGRSNPLTKINWFRVVLDEGHIIRTQSSEQSKATCALSGTRRWAITGTPIQNRLEDLGALIKFLKIEPFDQARTFATYMIAPFKTADTENIPKLRLLVESITLRRNKDKLNLPERLEPPPIKLKWAESERSFYDFFAKEAFKKVNLVIGDRQKIGGSAYAHILRAILRLRQLCAHGADLLSDEDWEHARGWSESTAINLEEEDYRKPDRSPRQAFELFKMVKDAGLNNCEICHKRVTDREFPEDESEEDEDTDGDDTFGYLTPCNHLICPGCIKDHRNELENIVQPDGYVNCPRCESYIRATFFPLKQHELDLDNAAQTELRKNPRLARSMSRYSGEHTKVKTLVADLEKNADDSAKQFPGERPIKSVVFSGWTNYLDLIAVALVHHEIGYARLDGTMPRKARNEALRQFTEDDDVACILVSITAGGLGLNLTAASRVYVMEPQFNPMQEAQAIERVHRLGQTRPVLITKYIMEDSFEERMVRLQEKKKSLAEMSLEKGARFDKVETAKKKLEDLRTLFK